MLYSCIWERITARRCEEPRHGQKAVLVMLVMLCDAMHFLRRADYSLSLSESLKWMIVPAEVLARDATALRGRRSV